MNLIASLRQIKASFLVEMALLFGGGITLLGLLQQKWPEVLPITNFGKVEGSLFFVLGSSCITALAIKLTKRGLPLTIIILSGIIALMAGYFGALLAVGLYAAASLSLGHIVIKSLGVDNESVNDTHRILLGAGIYASLVSLIAHLPINYASLYYLGLLLPIACVHRWFAERIKLIIKSLSKPSPPITLWDAPKVLLGSLILLHFAFAFFPELSNDGLVTHLFVPAHLALRHSWGFNPSLYVWSLMPMLGDWNYGIGYMMAGEVAVRLINVGFIYLMMALGRELILWAGGNEKGTIWGMLLFLATPLTFLESSSIFIESIWTCYLLAGLIWAFQVSSLDSKGRIDGVVLSGLMFGLAAATKAITLIYLPVFFLVMLLGIRFFNTQAFWKAVGKGLLLFSLFGIIPYVTAYLKTGNPVFPMYNAYFKSPFYDWSNFADTRFHSPLSWKLPYLVVFNSSKYIEGTVGSAGFQWTMLLMAVVLFALLSKNKKFAVLMVVEFLLIAIAFYFQGYLRYLFLSFLIFSVLVGVSITSSEKLSRFLKWSWILAVSITVVLNLLFFGSSVWSYRDVPVLEVFSSRGRNQVLLDRAPIRKMVEVVNERNKEGSPVIFLCFPHGAGLKADALYNNWYNPHFEKDMEKAITPLALVNLFRKYGSSYIIVDKNYATAEQLAVLEEATQIVSSYGRMSLRILKKESLETTDKK